MRLEGKEGKVKRSNKRNKPEGATCNPALDQVTGCCHGTVQTETGGCGEIKRGVNKVK